MIETPLRPDESPHDERDETPEESISALTPLCAAEFTELVAGMMADEAPHLFAVVQEYGQRVDGRIAAWGMAFEDHAEVISVDGHGSLSVRSPERAARRFNRYPNITAHVVWVNPDTPTPPHEIDTPCA